MIKEFAVFRYSVLIVSLALGLTLDLAQAQAQGTRTRNIVFDLDWTLVEEVKDGRPVDPARTLTVDGKAYRVTTGARELITSLAARPDVRISFFSGGSSARNEKLLRKLTLLDGSGRSFLDVAYKVLSFEDLTKVCEDPEKKLPFTACYRKDLTKISPDLKNTVLTDDNADFVLDGQRPCLLWTGKAYTSYDTYAQARAAYGTAQDRRHIPSTPEEWLRNEHKLQSIGNQLSRALRNEDQDLVSALAALPASEVSCDARIERALLQMSLHSP